MFLLCISIKKKLYVENIKEHLKKKWKKKENVESDKSFQKISKKIIIGCKHEDYFCRIFIVIFINILNIIYKVCVYVC